MTGEHLVPLGDTGWSVWRDALLRSAGFPADGLTALSAPDAARAADELLAGRDATVTPDTEKDVETDFEAAFAAALTQNAARVRTQAGDPLFREAVTWQNTNALLALDGLAATALDAPRNVRRREREKAVLKYWQRYCGKNETVGFFGPSCWGLVDPALDRPAVVTPGPALTRRRWVVFEAWAVHAVADAIGADPAVRRWWPPTLCPQLSFDGRTVHRPGRPPLTVSPAEAAVLAACDGKQPAVALVADPALGLRREADGYTLLDHLVERDLIRWDANLPNTPAAEAVLRQRISDVGEEETRRAAGAKLDRLTAARDGVAAAAGDPDALRTALATLDETFTDLTGQSPRRRDGQTYAGRTLCYEDTARDLDVTFGRPLLDLLAGPLDLLLRASRWLAARLEAAYTDALRGLYAELRAEGEVRLSDLWFLAQAMFFGTGERPVDVVADEFASRWAALFDLAGADGPIQVSSAELLARVDERFPALPMSWSAGRLHSPDLQLVATGPDALASGEYTVVLGELHTAWATFDNDAFTSAHPDPERLRTALAEDLGPRRVRPLYPMGWPRRTSRIAESLTGPTDVHLGFAPTPGVDGDRLVSTTALWVSDVDGSLVVTAPDGRQWPLIEVFSGLVATHAVDGFKLTSPAPHTPRITVDDVVVSRETWRTTTGGTGLADVVGERACYLAVRRWRRALGLPERVFVKIGTETKPCYVDLSSPLHATLLTSMVRAAVRKAGTEVSVVATELLPAADQAWVPDAAGRHYVSELRLHIVDGSVR